MGTTSSIGFVGFHLSTSLYNQQPTLSNFLPDSLALIYQQKESADMTETTRPGRLAGKTALITGGAGGIGLETTILFAREGAAVLMADISEPALARALAKVKELVPNAPRLETIKCDVSKESDIAAAVESQDAHGGVDIMFNNAGIIHTASFVALMGAATPQLAYTASKGAVLAMTRELAIVHARENIRFNALCPGPLNTPLLQDWLGDDLQKRHRREVHFPSGRFGEAIEQAQAVLFLASDESSFINATEFVVDGGLSKAYVTAEGPPAAAPLNNVR